VLTAAQITGRVTNGLDHPVKPLITNILLAEDMGLQKERVNQQ